MITMNKLKFHILFLILFLGWSCKNTSSETVTNDEVVSDVEIYNDIQRVEPPNWWTGFKSDALQLLVHHDNIGAATPSINSGGITISKVHKADSPNYLFLDLIINPNAKPGNYTIVFTFYDQTELKQTYTLNQRQKSA